MAKKEVSAIVKIQIPAGKATGEAKITPPTEAKVIPIVLKTLNHFGVGAFTRSTTFILLFFIFLIFSHWT